MITFDLTPDEEQLLREMMESALSDLRMEIAGTDRMAFRDHLKKRKGVIQKVLDTIPVAATPMLMQERES
jgi:hypothetical protein